tara:strand:+ start:947 stop:1297 length:351 start_codon:yes stop_codon:yes gene_type:complete
MNLAELTEIEFEIIEYIRFVGTFTQPSLVQSLKLSSKPPALSILCESCRKIGLLIPNHFIKVREWSKEVSLDDVRWDGDLICSTTFNIDGIRLTPESGTTQYHNFAVHPELFKGLD